MIGPKRSEFRQNRPRAHRENIADDPADAGGRALERFDRARMIVALDLERDRPAVADIDDAGIFFARFDQNVRPRSSEISSALSASSCRSSARSTSPRKFPAR